MLATSAAQRGTAMWLFLSRFPWSGRAGSAILCGMWRAFQITAVVLACLASASAQKPSTAKKGISDAQRVQLNEQLIVELYSK